MVGSSVAEDRQLELAKALRVGDHIDSDDPLAPDREAEHEEQPHTRGGHDFVARLQPNPTELDILSDEILMLVMLPRPTTLGIGQRVINCCADTTSA